MVPLQRRNEMLDLSVHSDEKLSFREHMQAKINKAYMMFGINNFTLQTYKRRYDRNIQDSYWKI